MNDMSELKNSENNNIVEKAIHFHLNGNLQKASQLYLQCINQKINDPKVFSNYGCILKNLGKLDEAEKYLRKAVEINKNFANANFNLGITLFALGRISEGLEYLLKTCDIDAETPYLFPTIIDLINKSDISRFKRGQFKKVLNILIRRKDVPHQLLFGSLNHIYKDFISREFNVKKSFVTLVEDQLIINSLRKIIFRDSNWEIILTKTRSNFLKLINEGYILKNNDLKFLISLSEQCYLNDYVFSITKNEVKNINNLCNMLLNLEFKESYVCILSCYMSLSKILKKIPKLKEFCYSNLNLEDLTRSQLKEPLKEIELTKDIKKIGDIDNQISKIVRSQYEKNPYPKWKVGSDFKYDKIDFTQVINNEITPNVITYKKRQLDTLIAGCGTGQHILITSKYKNTKITAIDISLSSLSYAQRKINELNIDNVQLILADILNLDLLHKKFDIIESIGVLHHMQEPLLGLEKLINVLKSDGLIKLGLYSELGRQDVIRARQYNERSTNNINSDFIRNFRRRVLEGDLSSLQSLKKRPDFYTLSECLDLCFHTKEHRFTIKKIEETINLFGLSVLGFELPHFIKDFYNKNFPDDTKHLNLRNWALIEEKYPQIFESMYRFWVTKS